MNRGTLNSLYTPVGGLAAGGLVTGVLSGFGVIYVNTRLTRELAIQNTEILQLRAELAKATNDVAALRQMVAKTVKEVRKGVSDMKTFTESSTYSTRGSRRSNTQESERRRAPTSRREGRSVQVSDVSADVSEIDEFFD